MPDIQITDIYNTYKQVVSYQFLYYEFGRINKYITFKEGPTKTRQGGLRIVHRAVQPKMLSTGGERCPVMLLEEMLSRRPPEMRDSGPFYLTTISKPKGQGPRSLISFYITNLVG